MSGKEKTNATRKLDSLKIVYQDYSYGDGEAVSATEVARILKQPEDHVFKTLVTEGKSGNHYVFMIPAAEELDLKKAASAVGEKSVAMIKSKELLPLTGYIHGGCSPVGMKKQFRTVIHQTAESFPSILCSGGKIGYQIELSLEELRRALPIESADLIR